MITITVKPQTSQIQPKAFSNQQISAAHLPHSAFFYGSRIGKQAFADNPLCEVAIGHKTFKDLTSLLLYVNYNPHRGIIDPTAFKNTPFAKADVSLLALWNHGDRDIVESILNRMNGFPNASQVLHRNILELQESSPEAAYNAILYAGAAYELAGGERKRWRCNLLAQIEFIHTGRYQQHIALGRESLSRDVQRAKERILEVSAI